MPSSRDLQPESIQEIIEAVRAAIARQGISRDAFATDAGISKPTLDRCLAGQFSDKTFAKIEAVIGPLISDKSDRPADFGYLESGVQSYISDYSMYRFSFLSNNIIRIPASISWDKSNRCLVFMEFDKSKKSTHRSILYISPYTDIVNFVLQENFGYRIIMTRKIRISGDQSMRGVIVSPAERHPSVFSPSVSPVYIKKEAGLRPYATLETGEEHSLIYDALNSIKNSDIIYK